MFLGKYFNRSNIENIFTNIEIPSNPNPAETKN